MFRHEYLTKEILSQGLFLSIALMLHLVETVTELIIRRYCQIEEDEENKTPYHPYVLYFTWVYASFHPNHSDNVANVILLRKRLDAVH